MVETIHFPFRKKFYDSHAYESAVKDANFTNAPAINRVVIRIDRDCRFLADATLKLLCLCHHIVSLGKHLTLSFDSEECRCFTFLERCGFFRCLPQCDVEPTNPTGESDASVRYAGNSLNLLEIRKVSPTNQTENRPIPGELTDALGHLIKADCEELLASLQTVVSEFCSNVPEHSEAATPGFIYMHHYPATGNIIISVSDIGVGLLNSLRKGLRAQNHEAQNLSDEDLILEMFNNGLSRKGEGRGAGLNRAAKIAIRYNAALHVRLEQQLIDLQPKGDKITAIAFFETDCAQAKGTNITFTFNTRNL